MKKALKIGLVAGEASGDILGEGLIKDLKKQYPNAIFEGIAGPKMIAQGCIPIYPCEKLSVMGIVEVLGKLRSILKIRKNIISYFLKNPPDIFIGIDAPDFNIDVELKLKENGIKTIHYVSPSVWAWKQWRIHKIAKATDLVLAFLPFEKAFYDKFNVPCEFVGHTLADKLPLIPEKDKARKLLGISSNDPLLAILPGSRKAEVEILTPIFLSAVSIIKADFPDLKFIVPMVNLKRKEQFLEIKEKIAPDLDITIVMDQASAVLQSADTVLLASGTAALECMLAKSPMVVAYKIKPLSYFIAKRMVKTKFTSLPNLIANEEIVPELSQDECTVENIVFELTKLLRSDQSNLIEIFTKLHLLIKCDADQKATDAVIKLINEGQ